MIVLSIQTVMPKNRRKHLYDDEYDARSYSHLVSQGQAAPQSQSSYSSSKKRPKKKKSHRKRSRDREERPQIQKSLVDYDDISSDSDIISSSPSATAEPPLEPTSQPTRPSTSRSSSHSQTRHSQHHSGKRAESPATALRLYRDGRSRSTSHDQDVEHRSRSQTRSKSNKKAKRSRHHSPEYDNGAHGSHSYKDVRYAHSSSRTNPQTDSRDFPKAYADLPKAYIADYKDNGDKRYKNPRSYKYDRREKRTSRSPSSR